MNIPAFRRTEDDRDVISRIVSHLNERHRAITDAATRSRQRCGDTGGSTAP